MELRDAIDRIFDEIGPLLEPDYVMASQNRTTWELRLSGETVVTTSLDDRAGMLTFVIVLGEVAEGHEASHHVEMLRFNMMVGKTDGAQLALDAEGKAVLLQRCRADRFDAQVLIAHMRDLAERARAWRNILAAAPTGPSQTQSFVPGTGSIQA